MSGGSADATGARGVGVGSGLASSLTLGHPSPEFVAVAAPVAPPDMLTAAGRGAGALTRAVSSGALLPPPSPRGGGRGSRTSSDLGLAELLAAGSGGRAPADASHHRGMTGTGDVDVPEIRSTFESRAAVAVPAGLHLEAADRASAVVGGDHRRGMTGTDGVDVPERRAAFEAGGAPADASHHRGRTGMEGVDVDARAAAFRTNRAPAAGNMVVVPPSVVAAASGGESVDALGAFFAPPSAALTAAYDGSGVGRDGNAALAVSALAANATANTGAAGAALFAQSSGGRGASDDEELLGAHGGGGGYDEVALAAVSSGAQSGQLPAAAAPFVVVSLGDDRAPAPAGEGGNSVGQPLLTSGPDASGGFSPLGVAVGHQGSLDVEDSSGHGQRGRSSCVALACWNEILCCARINPSTGQATGTRVKHVALLLLFLLVVFLAAYFGEKAANPSSGNFVPPVGPSPSPSVDPSASAEPFPSGLISQKETHSRTGTGTGTPLPFPSGLISQKETHSRTGTGTGTPLPFPSGLISQKETHSSTGTGTGTGTPLPFPSGLISQNATRSVTGTGSPLPPGCGVYGSQLIENSGVGQFPLALVNAVGSLCDFFTVVQATFVGYPPNAYFTNLGSNSYCTDSVCTFPGETSEAALASMIEGNSAVDVGTKGGFNITFRSLGGAPVNYWIAYQWTGDVVPFSPVASPLVDRPLIVTPSAIARVLRGAGVAGPFAAQQAVRGSQEEAVEMNSQARQDAVAKAKLAALFGGSPMVSTSVPTPGAAVPGSGSSA